MHHLIRNLRTRKAFLLRFSWHVCLRFYSPAVEYGQEEMLSRKGSQTLHNIARPGKLFGFTIDVFEFFHKPLRLYFEDELLWCCRLRSAFSLWRASYLILSSPERVDFSGLWYSPCSGGRSRAVGFRSGRHARPHSKKQNKTKNHGLRRIVLWSASYWGNMPLGVELLSVF